MKWSVKYLKFQSTRFNQCDNDDDDDNMNKMNGVYHFLIGSFGIYSFWVILSFGRLTHLCGTQCGWFYMNESDLDIISQNLLNKTQFCFLFFLGSFICLICFKLNLFIYINRHTRNRVLLVFVIKKNIFDELNSATYYYT